MLLCGEDLDAVWHDSERVLALTRKTGFHYTRTGDHPAATRGEPPGAHARVLDVQRRAVREAAFEQRLTEDRAPTGQAVYWVTKLEARVLSGDYPEALAAAEQARRLHWCLTGLTWHILYHYYRALALAASYEAAAPEEQRAWRAELAGHQAQLAEWVALNPPMFRDKHALVRAEIARLGGDGEVLAAERAYEEAIAAAHDSGFIHHEALACELASRFYRGRRLARIAELYLREAHADYRRWGAHAKAGQLEQLHPQLVAGPERAGRRRATRRAARSGRGDQGVADDLGRDGRARAVAHAAAPGARGQRRAARGARGAARRRARDRGRDRGGRPRRAAVGHGRAALDPALRAADAAAGGARRGRRSGTVRARRVVRPRAAALDPVRADPAAGRGGGAALPRERSGLGGVPARAAAGPRAPGRAGSDLARERAAPGGRARGAAFGRGGGAARAAARRGDGDDVALAGSTGRGRRAGPPVRARVADWSVLDLDDEGALVRSAGAHREPALEPPLREAVERYSARVNPASPSRHVLQTGGRLVMPEIRRSSSAPAASTTATASSCSGWGRAARWRCRSACASAGSAC